MKRADHKDTEDAAETAPGEPAAKRVPGEAAAQDADDNDDDEAYELFVAYQEAGTGEEKDDEEEEEDLGSSDSDTSSDEEHRALTTVVAWRDGAAAGLLGAAQRAAVEAMSRSIYGGTDEGFREIADAVARADGASSSSSADRSNGTAGVRIVGMLVLRARPAPVEITQAFVAPTLRDAGIGKRLVRRALEHASTVLRAARVVCFAVGGSGGFYARVGFAPVHARDRADAAAGTPCADRAEMACTLVPGTHYDVDSDDDDDDYDGSYADDADFDDADADDDDDDDSFDDDE